MFSLPTNRGKVPAGARTAGVACVWVMLSGVGIAADPASVADGKQRYQQERAVCATRSSAADQKVCMQDAAAAYGQLRRSGLASTGNPDYASNAVQRCAALPANDREACTLRIQGQGTVQGSVSGGGLFRQIELPVR